MSDLISKEAAIAAIGVIGNLDDRAWAERAIRALPPTQDAAPALPALERYEPTILWEMAAMEPDDSGEYVRLDAVEALLSTRAVALDLSSITRVVLVDCTKREGTFQTTVSGDIAASIDVQDAGRTLKIFVNKRGL